MHRLVPDFILHQRATGASQGRLSAACLFVDVTGFSAMTDSLMQHGQAGAEVLAGVMRDALAPLISAVFEFGGFVATHAGDSFMALFPEQPDAPNYLDRALAAACEIGRRSETQAVFATPYGPATVTTETGLSAGGVRWGILESANRERAAFYFTGDAIDGAVAAEHDGGPGQVILHRPLRQMLGERVQVEDAGENARLLAVNGPLPLPQPFLPAPPGEAATAVFYPGLSLDQPFTGEFRQVTHVFVSLPGIRNETQLGGFMHIVFALLDRYGGLLKLQFGDKGVHLLVTWGAPVAFENDITRALSFVLDLQRETALPINAGVTHRLAHAGFAGSELSEEYAVFGRGVNLAARFMTTAPRGEVWLDEQVARRAEAEFEIEYVGPRSFKGFSQAEKVYRLLERRDFVETFYRGALTGRNRELQALSDFVAPAWSGGCAGMLVVWGEPGAGKSRLVHEFLLRLEKAQTHTFRTFTAQSDEILREPLNPFRYWLRTYFGLSEGMAEARNKRSFNRVLDDLIAATPEVRLADELDRTRSFLGALVGLLWPDSLYEQLDAQARYDNTFLALSALLQAESIRNPVLLFVEDIHWLDTDSRAFLVRLQAVLEGDELGRRPIAVIMTGRPEPGALPAELRVHELALGSMGREELRALAEAQVGGPVAPTVVDLLADRSDGNPFFAEQILIYLQEQGQLLETAAGWELVGSDPLPLTEGLQALLVARLDRLSRDIRETVQTAAVLGREFEVRLLSQMLHNRHVEELVQAAERQAIWAALTEIKYLFRHTLLRDAAYRMQILARRQALHALAVEALETLYRADLRPRYGELAYHAEQAGVQDKARLYLRLAAESARDAYQNAYAVGYYTRLLALTPEGECEARWEILAARENISGATGRMEERLADIRAMERLAGEMHDDDKRADAAFHRGDALLQQGKPEEAAEACEEAIALSRRAGRDDIECQAVLVRASLEMRRGEYAHARQRLAHALVLAQALGDQLLTAKALGVDGLAATYQGDLEHGRSCHERACVIAKEIRDERQLSKALNNLAVTIGSQGDLPRALELYEEALELSRTLGNISGEAIVLQNIGWMAAQLGEYGRAEKTFREALQLFRQAGELSDQESVWVNLAIVAEAGGRRHEAEQCIEQCLQISRQLGNRLIESYALTCRAYALCGLGRPEAALSPAQEALALRRELGNEALILEAHGALCQVYLALGEIDEARAVARAVLAALGGPELPNRSALNGAEQALRVVWECYRALLAANDAAANSVLAAAARWLSDLAAPFTGEDARQSLLEKVPWHREIVLRSSPWTS